MLWVLKSSTALACTVFAACSSPSQDLNGSHIACASCSVHRLVLAGPPGHHWPDGNLPAVCAAADCNRHRSGRHQRLPVMLQRSFPVLCNASRSVWYPNSVCRVCRSFCCHTWDGPPGPCIRCRCSCQEDSRWVSRRMQRFGLATVATTDPVWDHVADVPASFWLCQHSLAQPSQFATAITAWAGLPRPAGPSVPQKNTPGCKYVSVQLCV